MIDGCGNCANYVWGDKKTPLPNDCIKCTTTHVPNGQHPTPSHWKPKPQTNADRIRAMTDEELAKFIREPFCDKRTNEECKISYCGVCEVCVMDWLKEPAEVTDNGKE